MSWTEDAVLDFVLELVLASAKMVSSIAEFISASTNKKKFLQADSCFGEDLGA